MIARQSVWTNPEVLELAAHFVPAADEVHRLQSGSDPECRLFQKIAEQGHYGGRTRPTNTRQGTYAATPSGILLASINSNDPRQMADMLRRALNRWNELSPEERLLPEDPAAQAGAVVRTERFYPADGLVLKVFTRDLPRGTAQPGWRGNAWNLDYAWFRKAEARSLLPASLIEGETQEAPAELAMRIARLHLVDNVRGQTSPFPERAVERARLIAAVVKVEDKIASISFKGEMRTSEEGNWSVAGFGDMNSPSAQKRGYEATLLGFAKYDVSKERFIEFELLAAGPRWGGTTYNGRHDDLAPAPMGVVFVLAGDSPQERVAPAHFWSYGWR